MSLRPRRPRAALAGALLFALLAAFVAAGAFTWLDQYAVSHLMHEALKRCGNELTRANLMKQAASFKSFRVPLLLPGITANTSPTDFYPLQAVQLQRFKGETWELFGDIMHAESS